MSTLKKSMQDRQFSDDGYEIDDEEDSMKDRYLSFRVAEEEYGIEIQFVTEIVGIQKISSVPEMPDFIKGVINLRGQVIPVMDVRTRFHLSFREYTERTCVIVVNINDHFVGLVVDAVKDVSSMPETSISAAPRVARSESARYIKGIGKVGDEVKILLDVHKLLSDLDISSEAVQGT